MKKLLLSFTLLASFSAFSGAVSGPMSGTYQFIHQTGLEESGIQCPEVVQVLQTNEITEMTVLEGTGISSQTQWSFKIEDEGCTKKLYGLFDLAGRWKVCQKSKETSVESTVKGISLLNGGYGKQTEYIETEAEGTILNFGLRSRHMAGLHKDRNYNCQYKKD